MISIFALAMATCATQAAVIYTDDFSGAVGTALNGTAPDIRPGSEVWEAIEGVPLGSSDFRADGSLDGSSTGSLAFTVEGNKVYTFSLDLNISNMDSGSADWAGIGLNSSSPAPGWMLGDAFGNILLRRNGGAQALALGGSPTSINVGSGTYGTGTHELKMVLDTSASTWTVDFQIDGGSLGISNVDAADASFGTKYISIGSTISMAGSFDNLSLTVIPEPETIGLVGLVSFSLLVVRRLQI